MHKFDEHQLRIWKEMIEKINDYLSGSEDYRVFVKRLEGLLDASEIKDQDLIKEWYKFWTPLEIYNADRIDTGKEAKKEEIIGEIKAMSEFLINELKKLG